MGLLLAPLKCFPRSCQCFVLFVQLEINHQQYPQICEFIPCQKGNLEMETCGVD